MRASLAVLYTTQRHHQDLKQSATELIMCTAIDLDFWRRPYDGRASFRVFGKPYACFVAERVLRAYDWKSPESYVLLMRFSTTTR